MSTDAMQLSSETNKKNYPKKQESKTGNDDDLKNLENTQVDESGNVESEIFPMKSINVEEKNSSLIGDDNNKNEKITVERNDSTKLNEINESIETIQATEKLSKKNDVVRDVGNIALIKNGSAYDVASKVKENIIKHIEDPNNEINKSITQSKVENARNLPKLLITSSQDSIVHNTKSRNTCAPSVKDNFGDDCLSTHDNTKKKSTEKYDSVVLVDEKMESLAHSSLKRTIDCQSVVNDVVMTKAKSESKQTPLSATQYVSNKNCKIISSSEDENGNEDKQSCCSNEIRSANSRTKLCGEIVSTKHYAMHEKDSLQEKSDEREHHNCIKSYIGDDNHVDNDCADGFECAEETQNKFASSIHTLSDSSRLDSTSKKKSSIVHADEKNQCNSELLVDKVNKGEHNQAQSTNDDKMISDILVSHDNLDEIVSQDESKYSERESKGSTLTTEPEKSQKENQSNNIGDHDEGEKGIYLFEMENCEDFNEPKSKSEHENYNSYKKMDSSADYQVYACGDISDVACHRQRPFQDSVMIMNKSFDSRNGIDDSKVDSCGTSTVESSIDALKSENEKKSKDCNKQSLKIKENQHIPNFVKKTSGEGSSEHIETVESNASATTARVFERNTVKSINCRDFIDKKEAQSKYVENSRKFDCESDHKARTSSRENSNEGSTSIFSKLISLEKLKLSLYFSFVNEHKDKGPEKLFQVYLDKVARYLSSSYIPSQSMWDTGKWCDNVEGMEDFFNAFLKSQTMRILHNKFILAIMQNSMLKYLPVSKFKCHIPQQWKHRIKKRKYDPQQQNSSLTLKTVTKERKRKLDKMDGHNDRIQLEISRQIEKDCFDISTVWMESVEKATLSLHEQPLRKDEGLAFLSSPCALDMEPSVQQIVKDINVSISREAIWTVVFAVRHYIKSLLQHVILHAEGKEDGITIQKELPKTDKFSSSTSNTGNNPVQNKFITADDIKLTLSCYPHFGEAPFNSSLSNLLRDRCSQSRKKFCSTHQLQSLNVSITDEIMRATMKKLELQKERKVLKTNARFSNSSSSSGSLADRFVTAPKDNSTGLTPKRAVNSVKFDLKHLEKDSLIPQRTSKSSPIENKVTPKEKCNKLDDNNRNHQKIKKPTPLGRGRGVKNLSALRASVDQKESSSSTQKNTTFREDQDSKKSTSMENTDADESETKPITPQKLSRGKGYGIKDLASLKQRSLGLKNNSSGANPDTKRNMKNISEINDKGGNENCIDSKTISLTKKIPLLRSTPMEIDIDDDQSQRRKALRRNAMIPTHRNLSSGPQRATSSNQCTFPLPSQPTLPSESGSFANGSNHILGVPRVINRPSLSQPEPIRKPPDFCLNLPRRSSGGKELTLMRKVFERSRAVSKHNDNGGNSSESLMLEQKGVSEQKDCVALSQKK